MKYDILDKLYRIYREYVGHIEPGQDSQLCMIWSADNPPDILQGTLQLENIEETFEIAVNEDDAAEMFDMTLIQASSYIEKLIKKRQS